MIKIGLTAADRGHDRLLEQGAVAYTRLATGPYTPIRRAERLISAAGLAKERLPGRAVIRAWWTLPPADERVRLVQAAYDATIERVRWPNGLTRTPCAVVDQTSDFGLHQPPPDSYAELVGLTGGAVLAGTVRLIVGRRLLLDADGGGLLVDMRRIAGWALTPSAARAATGVHTAVRTQPPRGDRDNQDSLF